MKERTFGNLTVQRYTLVLLFQCSRFGSLCLRSLPGSIPSRSFHFLLAQEWVINQRIRSKALHLGRYLRMRSA